MLCFFAISVSESAPWSNSCSIFTFVLRSFGGQYVPRLAITLGIEITSVARPPKTRRTAATCECKARNGTVAIPAENTPKSSGAANFSCAPTKNMSNRSNTRVHGKKRNCHNPAEEQRCSKLQSHAH
ncbi:hypothetical protein ISCGN_027896 [Ixodes scapularis]